MEQNKPTKIQIAQRKKNMIDSKIKLFFIIFFLIIISLDLLGKFLRYLYFHISIKFFPEITFLAAYNPVAIA